MSNQMGYILILITIVLIVITILNITRERRFYSKIERRYAIAKKDDEYFWRRMEIELPEYPKMQVLAKRCCINNIEVGDMLGENGELEIINIFENPENPGEGIIVAKLKY